MPSYIELNQNSTLPASSQAGRVVFGINALGQAVVVDSSGNTLILSQSAATGSGIFSGSFSGDGSGILNVLTASYALSTAGGGGGGNTPATPGVNDFSFVYNYSNWIYGSIDKFETLNAEVDPTDYIELTLTGGQVNGIPFSITPSQSIHVAAGGVTYRDDYDGLVPVNYVDFVNGLLSSSGLHTRITGSAQDPNGRRYVANYCRTDNFAFYFKETGSLNGAPLGETYYSLYTVNGGYLMNGYGDSFETTTMYQATQPWTLIV